LSATVEHGYQERLDLLVRAGEIFHQSLDVTATLNDVARLAVEAFAEICLFDLIDERSERLFVTASAHRDPSKEGALASVASILYVEEFGIHPVVQVTRTGRPFFLPYIDDDVIARHAASRAHEQYMRRFDYGSKIVVPVTAQDHLFGALTFVRTRASVEFNEADLLFALELGRRAGLAVANAKQFHREQHVAETLQRSFLPYRFPKVDGIDLSAHYRAGSTDAAVGGDWYDAFETESGNILITIGDVTGKGVDAARLMVLMRQAIRVAALESEDPKRIADLCNRLLLSEGEERFASAFIGILDAKSGRVNYVSAGHVPPLLRTGPDEVRSLKAPDAPLGAFRNARFCSHTLRCPPGSMLVLFTDGLIEVSRDVIDGQTALQRVVSSEAAMHAANAAEFIERAIAHEAPRDDIAILTVTFGARERRWQFEAEDARAAYAMREDYFRTLERACRLDEDTSAACSMIFGELIGNAVRHAPGSLSVSLEARGDDLVLHVIDKGPGFAYEPALPKSLWDEGGRGLFLVGTLARDVQVERLAGMGSHITATLPVNRTPNVAGRALPARANPSGCITGTI
jgi:serine phosphatase RsbU (regulator of sigma subunit)/anti-sigma regulatory factor (Ser/Thr protein kinase)